MLKHVGIHKNKKIVLLFREVPGEDHMCLIVYSDDLTTLLHDEVMRVLESPAGQQSQSFSDALHRHIMSDGRNCLQALHLDRLIKKVPTNSVTITPNNKSQVQLDELNRILNGIEIGKKTTKELKELEKKAQPDTTKSTTTAPSDLVLSDQDLAQQLIKQSKQMQADANRLLLEAQAMMNQAAELDPSLKNEPNKKKTTKAKKD